MELVRIARHPATSDFGFGPSFGQLEELRTIEAPDRFAVQVEAVRLFLLTILRLVLFHTNILFLQSRTDMAQPFVHGLRMAPSKYKSDPEAGRQIFDRKISRSPFFRKVT